MARIVEKNPTISEFFAAFSHLAFAQASAHQLASRGASARDIPKVSSVSYQRIE